MAGERGLVGEGKTNVWVPQHFALRMSAARGRLEWSRETGKMRHSRRRQRQHSTHRHDGQRNPHHAIHDSFHDAKVLQAWTPYLLAAAQGLGR